MIILWIKVLHITSVVCWFAGLFYLPRLFVYHSMAEENLVNNPSELTAIKHFKIMERKLYYGITTPSMIATWLTGAWLLYLYGWVAYSSMGWLHTKLLLVLLLTVYHLSMGYFYKKFLHNNNKHRHIFYRYYNEIPVLFLLVIVALVILKSF